MQNCFLKIYAKNTKTLNFYITAHINSASCLRACLLRISTSHVYYTYIDILRLFSMQVFSYSINHSSLYSDQSHPVLFQFGQIKCSLLIFNQSQPALFHYDQSHTDFLYLINHNLSYSISTNCMQSYHI